MEHIYMQNMRFLVCKHSRWCIWYCRYNCQRPTYVSYACCHVTYFYHSQCLWNLVPLLTYVVTFMDSMRICCGILTNVDIHQPPITCFLVTMLTGVQYTCTPHLFWILLLSRQSPKVGLAPTGCGVWTICPGLLPDSGFASSQTHDFTIIGSDMLTTRLSSHTCSWYL